MRKSSKAVIHSAAAIVLSASLIAGSTFALFTSESKVNIAITSGKVEVKAAAALVSGYSAKYEEGKYINDPCEGPVTEGTTQSITFSNGGTAKYDTEENTLRVANITPGDGVTFNLTATNESTIAIKYQTVVTYQKGGVPNADAEGYEKEDNALYRALKITVGDETSDAYTKMKDFTSSKSTAVSGWTSIEAEAEIKDISVTIELPMEAGNEVQGMGCELILGLYAVQANGNDTTNQDVYFVSGDSNLSEVFDSAESGDTIVLNDDVDLTQTTGTLDISGKDLTLDLNGNNFEAKSAKENQKADDIVIGEGSTLTLKNSAEPETEGELPKFTVEVDSTKDNYNQFAEGNYAMHVNGGNLNVEGVELDIIDKQGDVAFYVDGGEVNFDENAKLNMTGKDNNDPYGKGFGVGMLVTGESTVNLQGTHVHTYGALPPFIVGANDDPDVTSTLNLNGANVEFENLYNSTTKNTVVAGLQTYAGGEINIADSNITLKGDTKQQTGSSIKYSSSVALSCVGGGDINFENSTLTLDVEGSNVAAQALTNYDEQGVSLHAHIRFESGSKIIGWTNSGKTGRNLTLFAAQRNGSQEYIYDKESLTGGKDVKVDSDNPYSIIIEEGVTITVNDKEVTGTEGFFSKSDTLDPEKWLAAYTKDAIQDNRSKS